MSFRPSSRHSSSRTRISLIDPQLDRLTRRWNLSDRTRIAKLRRQSRAARHSAIWSNIQRAVSTDVALYP